MGQYLEGVTEMGAGNILSIGGLDEIVFKTATLSSSPFCPYLAPINLGA
jgi:ribosome assembly protein 1